MTAELSTPSVTDAPFVANAMSVDVEDYFQVSAMAPYIDRTEWEQIPCRVERNVERLLELFAEAGVKITFFTLGWIAERYPQMVRDIVSSGHELASHGYDHTRATDQDPERFRADVRRTKEILEQIGGIEVRGYRAASYSIAKKNLWALRELEEAGYRYSSSIYPIRHDHYGIPDAPRFPYFPHGEEGILEVPITTLEINGRRWPAGGGGFFRLFPYSLSRWAISRINQREQRPTIFYFHPWEIDPEQPRPSGLNLKTRFRHYVNLSQMERRLQRLLSDFRWDRMDHIFLENRHSSAATPQS